MERGRAAGPFDPARRRLCQDMRLLPAWQPTQYAAACMGRQ
jgi:hypothetical protein